MRHLCLAFLLACSPLVLAAQQDWARARQDAEALIRQRLGEQTLVLRWEAADPPSLPACAELDYQWPAQPRGKVLVVASCRSGQKWTARLPVWISPVVPLAFVREALPREHVVAEEDIEWKPVELARYPEDVALAPAQVHGRVTRQAVPAGQALRVGQLRAAWVVQRGQQVRVRVVAPGFAVTSEGVAQNDAGTGERVRVRTASGQIIEGTAADDGSVQIPL